MPAFTFLIESALLHAKHKCSVEASTLAELISAINMSLNLEQPTLLIEVYDKEFESFVGTRLSMSVRHFLIYENDFFLQLWTASI
jgi:hypothetical protein